MPEVFQLARTTGGLTARPARPKGQALAARTVVTGREVRMSVTCGWQRAWRVDSESGETAGWGLTTRAVTVWHGRHGESSAMKSRKRERQHLQGNSPSSTINLR